MAEPINIADLKPGDIIRHRHSKEGAAIVTANYGDRVTAVRTFDVTNPIEWELLVKGGGHEPQERLPSPPPPPCHHPMGLVTFTQGGFEAVCDCGAKGRPDLKTPGLIHWTAKEGGDGPRD